MLSCSEIGQAMGGNKNGHTHGGPSRQNGTGGINNGMEQEL